jgi:hypothetical protein
MAVVIVATAMSPVANSYTTLAEADTYHESVLYSSAWDDATDDEKNRALVTATAMLDVWFEWYGEVTTLTQALFWPRRAVLKPGVSDGQVQSAVVNDWHEPYGHLLDQNVVPDIIKKATAELARNMLIEDRTADSDTQTQGLKSLKAGPVELVFTGGGGAKPIPDSVMVMCTLLGRPRNKSGTGMIQMYRG